MWGDQVGWVPTNNRWPISVTSHHLALPTWLLALRHFAHTENRVQWPWETQDYESQSGAVVSIPAEHAGVLSLQAVWPCPAKDGVASQSTTNAVLRTP